MPDLMRANPIIKRAKHLDFWADIANPDKKGFLIGRLDRPTPPAKIILGPVKCQKAKGPKFLKVPLCGRECATGTARARAIRPETKNQVRTPIFGVLGIFGQ